MKADSIRFDTDAIRLIIATEIALHPERDAIDLFKLLYQAHLGPHHIGADRERIIAHIRAEILGMGFSHSPALQDIGAGNGFYRVGLSHLDFLKTEDPVDLLADLILASRFEDDPAPDAFPAVWQGLIPLVNEYVTLDDDTIRAINKVLDKDLVPRHSERFRAAYNPRYRLVHHSVLSDYIDRIFPVIGFLDS